MRLNIEERKLPDLLTFFDGKKIENTEDWQKRKTELLDYLEKNIYGAMPENPISVTAETVSTEKDYCAGDATLSKINLTVNMKTGSYTFPIYAALPVNKPKALFVLVNFQDNVPNRYYPTEEIIDSGCGCISFCYRDVTSDDGDFENGIAPYLVKMSDARPGKITMWAYAAMRVRDYIEQENINDSAPVIIIGHSRLGKTALWTGAHDERFDGVISNDSGCCGAAVERGKIGERYADIYRVFAYWFCEEFKNHLEEANLNADQHALIALSAPRKLCVASAELDEWADPLSEFYGIKEAAPVWKLFGKSDFGEKAEWNEKPFSFTDGNLHYHCRYGSHYLSRRDWIEYLKFFTK